MTLDTGPEESSRKRKVRRKPRPKAKRPGKAPGGESSSSTPMLDSRNASAYPTGSTVTAAAGAAAAASSSSSSHDHARERNGDGGHPSKSSKAPVAKSSKSPKAPAAKSSKSSKAPPAAKSSRPSSSRASPHPLQVYHPTTADASPWPGGSAGRGPHAVSGGFKTGEDFIPFDFSDDEKEEGKDVPSVVSPGKGKDKGKGKGKGQDIADRDALRGGGGGGGGKQNGVKRSAEVMEDADGYANKKQRTDAASRLTPWIDSVNWDHCHNLAEMLHHEVKAFVDYISPTPEEHEVRGMIIIMITRAVQQSWPDARISPFGSYETKLYLPLGDIDLVVESRAMESLDKRRILYNLAQVLRRMNVTESVQVIAKAKVPIIKFVTSHGRFAVDISLNQSNGLTAGRIVKKLLRQLPALQSLVMVVKQFLNQRSLNEVYTGGLGSYAIVCMTVSFLQMHPKIRAGEINPSDNLGVLVIEFFELYGHYFNYDSTGISLRDGGTYFNKTARGWNDFRHPSLLSIEDPIDTSNDISKNSFNIPRIRKTMAGAHEVLTAVALTRSRILMSKARGEYTNLRGSHSTRGDDNQSILGSVMGVTQETLNHRLLVKQLYVQSTLQDFLGLPRYRPPEPAASTAPQGLSEANIASFQVRSRQAVERAWGEADMDLGNPDRDLMPSRLASPDGEEESRYSARHPRKRRRVDSPKFSGARPDTIFVEASEEDEVIAPQVQAAPSTSRGSREGTVQFRDAPPDDGRVEARRAYWASKGMSGGGLEESD